MSSCLELQLRGFDLHQAIGFKISKVLPCPKLLGDLSSYWGISSGLEILFWSLFFWLFYFW